VNSNPPFYNPPYDSPLEDDFALNVTKYLEPTLSLIPQYEVKTICGTFRIDFVVQGPSGLTGFECDGKDFHDASRDEWRDAMIMGTKTVNSIYRLRGADIYYRIEDILYIVSRWNPELFSQRGIVNLERLASPEAKSGLMEVPRSIAIITYKNDENDWDENGPVHLCMERRHLESPRGKRQFWEAAYRFATEIGGGKLDDVISKYRAQKKDEPDCL
jgi:hypothetical protein